jgi:hypothetical protein
MTKETAPDHQAPQASRGVGDLRPASAPGGAGRSLHRSAPEVLPTRALAVSAAILLLWATATFGAPWIAPALAELLTRIELRVIADGLPWTR